MKLIPLYDLQQEINRLFIAGSKFAKNDPRLQKQVAVFNKLGEKSPVFKKIADGIENLIQAESNDSSAKLLEISTLLYAVLYTQGETAEAEQTETELNPTLPLEDIFTGKSYLALKPLIVALANQKEGRMNDVKTAFEDGQFKDFRTYHLANIALADRYAELADYFENTVIPSIGQPILPFILNSFNYEGKTDDVRRFRILAKFGYPKLSGMVDEIFAGKSIPLQVEAVKTLGKNPDNEELLVKFSGDKQKPIRVAAYETLANLNKESAQQTLVDLFIANKKKSDTSELSEVLKINLPNKFIPILLDKAKNDFEKCIESNKSADIKVINTGFDNLRISMNPLVNNADEDILTFYKDVFSNKKYKELVKVVESKSNYNSSTGLIVASVADSLENMNEGVECLKFLTENTSDDAFLYSYFRASVKYGADKKSVYDYFSKHAEKLLKGTTFAEAFLDETGKLNKDNIDSQWTKLLGYRIPKMKEMQIDTIRIYVGLAGEKSKETQSLLLDIVKSSKQVNYYFNNIADLLIDSGYPKAVEVIFDTICSLAAKQYVYISNAEFLKKFPKEYAEKFRKFPDSVKTKTSYLTETFYAAADKIEEAHFTY
jgi:hypothetical protein